MNTYPRMNGTQLQISRLALGLTVKAFGALVGKYERSIREYEARKYEPSEEVTTATRAALADMAKHLKPYLELRNGNKTPRVITAYSTEEELHAAAPEFAEWSLDQHKMFLSHVAAILTAKDIEYIITTPSFDS
ncbi:hypothetical protein [Rothia nasimurium]|uniref:hypothetical protein n=1 Tax=Rothia nasimurium TaxID=85336 RepID=UPI003BA0C97C